MVRKRSQPLYVAGIIERFDNTMLIVRPHDEGEARSNWIFPRGPAGDDESPEEAMRRLARTQLGIDVEVIVGQPPLVETIDGQRVELRVYFCGVQHEASHTHAYAESRWINKAHLSEYDFDRVSQPIVDWLIEYRR